MMADPKERAEHVMLVDLGRNDVGKVAKFGSVHVDDFMSVEKYSHVQHIVSNVVGDLRDDMDPIDVLMATFPAGTVSGAPKTRAMQIIEELEGRKRGLYAGCVGYFCFNSNADLAIAIRTILLKNKKAYVQAGAGIVMDSVPENEYVESINKGAAMLKALGRSVKEASRTMEGSKMKVLIVDNIDSFVYNLYQYVGELGGEPEVVPNTITIERDPRKGAGPDHTEPGAGEAGGCGLLRGDHTERSARRYPPWACAWATSA